MQRAARPLRHLAPGMTALLLVHLFCLSVGGAVTAWGEAFTVSTGSASHLVSDGHRDEGPSACRICHTRTHLVAVVAWPASCSARLDADSWPLLAWHLPGGGRSGFLLRPP